jgi:hypothetical protein
MDVFVLETGMTKITTLGFPSELTAHSVEIGLDCFWRTADSFCDLSHAPRENVIGMSFRVPNKSCVVFIFAATSLSGGSRYTDYTL